MKIKKIYIKDISVISWGMLVFFMIFLPAGFQPVKIILLMTVFLFSRSAGRWMISIGRDYIRFFELWFLFYFSNTVLGCIYGNPGILSNMKLNIIYYAVFFVLIGRMKQEKYVYVMIRAMYYANICISLYSFAFLAYARKWIGDWFPILDPTSGVGLHEDYTHITTTHLSMMIFTFPFLMMITNTDHVKANYNKVCWNMMLVMSAVSIVLSGRRILWIVLLVAVLVFFLTEQKTGRKMKYAAVIVIVLALMMIIFGMSYHISFGGLANRMKAAFSPVDERGNVNVRFEQAWQLWNGFLEHPVFGNGSGAVLQGYYRTLYMPWAFELSYNKILFDGGIIGAAVYAAALWYIVFSLYKRRKKPLSKGILLAYLLGLLANATNPYFSQNFDFLIFIMAPLLYVNAVT